MNLWSIHENEGDVGADALLEELFQAMSSQEAQENLEHIDQMHDLGLFPELDEDEEEE